MVSMKSGFIFFISAQFLLSGCVHRPDSNIKSDEKIISQATGAIDGGRYEEAVTNLETFVSTNPTDDRARLLLSNAYVRWAGVKFSDFIPLARYYLDQSENKFSPRQNNMESLLKSLGQSQKAAVRVVHTFEKAFYDLEAFSAVFRMIPDLSEDQHAHFSEGLKQAVILGSAKKGNVLYRVILRVVEMKYTWVRGDLFNFMDDQCRIVSPRVSTFFKRTRDDYQVISQELTFVYPNLNDEFLGDLDQFEKAGPEVQNTLESVYGISPRSDGDPKTFTSFWTCL